MSPSPAWRLAAGLLKTCLLASLALGVSFPLLFHIWWPNWPGQVSPRPGQANQVLSHMWWPTWPGQAAALALSSPGLVEEDVEVARRDRLARVCRQYRGQTNMQIVYDR